MAERENLPAVITAQAVAVRSEQRGSLVGRGLAVLRKDNDALYRQARTLFDRLEKIGWGAWTEKDALHFDSAIKTFQHLADENYGKAYFPLSRWKSSTVRYHYIRVKVFDWCFANQANQDVELWCDLGEMYSNGWGVEKNYEQAMYWYRKAADHGLNLAQWNLGEMFACGHGVEQDSEQAEYWYRKAAEQADPFYQTKLGGIYRVGRGVPQDYKHAVYWFTKAAEQGDKDGQFNLGFMYAKGRGVGQDDEQAVYWFRKAAEQGVPWAQVRLAIRYKNGVGVERDIGQAEYWYRKAASITRINNGRAWVAQKHAKESLERLDKLDSNKGTP